ncbi:MAG: CcdB family protein [Hyphomonadaceae bacterium]|nr:CcdB family protein [Hyphomonadaceae bacterium]
MARFDVHRLTEPSSFDYVVILQSEFYDHLEIRLVVPIAANHRQIDPIVNPTIEFDGRAMLLKTEFMATISQERLGRKLGDLSKYEYEISRAIDRLTTGF